MRIFTPTSIILRQALCGRNSAGKRELKFACRSHSAYTRARAALSVEMIQENGDTLKWERKFISEIRNISTFTNSRKVYLLVTDYNETN